MRCSASNQSFSTQLVPALWSARWLFITASEDRDTAIDRTACNTSARHNLDRPSHKDSCQLFDNTELRPRMSKANVTLWLYVPLNPQKPKQPVILKRAKQSRIVSRKAIGRVKCRRRKPSGAVPLTDGALPLVKRMR